MLYRLTLLLTFQLMLLNLPAQMQVALFAGPQLTSAQYKVRGEKQGVDYKMGFTAGGGMKVVFDNHLYFFPSLYYSMKGYKVSLDESAFPPAVSALNNNTTIHTMELCPMFQIDITKKSSHPFIRFGAAVDVAISGRESFDSVSSAGIVHVSQPMKFSFTEYGRFSASANFHLGYETGSRFMVWAFYNHGIGSMNNADHGPTILHRIFGVSFGWLLGKPLKA